MRKFFWILFFPLILSAQEAKTPEQVQGELEQAEKRFQHAKELFNPYYTGPLITPSAAMIPPGMIPIRRSGRSPAETVIEPPLPFGRSWPYSAGANPSAKAIRR